MTERIKIHVDQTMIDLMQRIWDHLRPAHSTGWLVMGREPPPRVERGRIPSYRAGDQAAVFVYENRVKSVIDAVLPDRRTYQTLCHAAWMAGATAAPCQEDQR